MSSRARPVGKHSATGHKNGKASSTSTQIGVNNTPNTPQKSNGDNPLTFGPKTSPVVCVQDLESIVNTISENIDHLELRPLLQPVLEGLVQLDKATEAAFLEHRIKPRFGMSFIEVRAYGGMLADLRKEKIISDEKTLHHSVAEAPPPELTDEERSEAMALLTDNNIVETIINDIATMGYVGEDANKLILYCVATSRKQSRPLSAIIKSPAAYGKSELTKTIIKLMPPRQVLEFTRITPQALAYMPEGGLQNKWVVVMERHGSESADYNIRILQSEQKIKIAYAASDPETGRMQTNEREVLGPVAFTETTTRPTLNPENASRVFELYLDGSEKQTRAIHDAQRRAVTLAGYQAEAQREVIARKHINAQGLLEPIEVAIPYSNSINFPTSNSRARRDFQKFLEFIKAVAFLRQFQKKRRTDRKTGRDYIEADLQDYYIAYQYLAPVLAQNLDELPPHSHTLLEAIKRVVSAKEVSAEGGAANTIFTRRDVVRWSKAPAHQVHDYIKPLEDLGYLEIVTGGQGKQYSYRLKLSEDGDTIQNVLSELTTPEALKKAWNKDVKKPVKSGKASRKRRAR